MAIISENDSAFSSIASLTTTQIHKNDINFGRIFIAKMYLDAKKFLVN
jgi:hypothetical protein